MQNQHIFLPAFPIKANHRFKSHSRKNSDNQSKAKNITKCSNLTAKPSNFQESFNMLKISEKICRDLCILNNHEVSNSGIISYRNQNNFCEMNALIMTPIRLTNVEICLPEYSDLGSPKAKPRKILTSNNKKRLPENRYYTRSLGNVPAEIIATGYSSRVSSARPRLVGVRRSDRILMSKSEHFSHVLIRNGTSRESNLLPRKAPERNRVNECESISPNNYSPVYINNFEV